MTQTFEPGPRPAAGAEALLAALRWRSTVFHVGQYCGAWQASTAGRGVASFHLVLRGRCELQRPGQPALPLAAGDAVFFGSDQPHHLGPPGVDAAACRPQAMQATVPAQPDGTALACGFLHHDGPLSAWLLRALPGPLLLRHDDHGHAAQAARTLFALMRDEADSDTPRLGSDQPGPALARLADLLVLYLLRQAMAAPPAADAQPESPHSPPHAPPHDAAPQARDGSRHSAPNGTLQHALNGAPAGVWALAASRDLGPLLPLLLADPAADWTAERMAAAVHLSRAAFFRRFQQTTGDAPAQFLLRLRMVLAGERLQQGASVERAAEVAGFQSPSAFHRAFVRVMGRPPGRYARDR